MYRIDKRDFGYRLTFSGLMPVHEIEAWLAESELLLPKEPEPFYVFVDMRDLELLPPESRPGMIRGQKLYRQRGMVRSVVILSDKVTALQFKGIAKETGIYDWERYIDTSVEPDWERTGMAWLTDAVDPDGEPVPSSSEVTAASSEPSADPHLSLNHSLAGRYKD
jgi:hypothetical protein